MLYLRRRLYLFIMNLVDGYGKNFYQYCVAAILEKAKADGFRCVHRYKEHGMPRPGWVCADCGEIVK